MVMLSVSSLFLLCFVYRSFSEPVRKKRFSLTQEALELPWENVGLEGLRSIRGVIGRSNVKHLDLSNNFIDDEGAVEVAEILRVSSKLTSINIAKNPITSIGMAHIADALKSNDKITSLDVSFTKIGPSGASMLFEALRDERSAIKQLDVSHCGIQDDGAADLGRMLRRHRTLESLSVDMNDISEDGSESLMLQLKHNAVLRKLSYSSGNILSTKAAEHLAEFLTSDRCVLSVLHLNNCVMGAAAISSLIAGVENSKSLIELNIKGVDLSGSAKQVFEALARNKYLKVLDVSSAKLEASDATFIADMIRNNSVLTLLNIGYNRIQSNGAMILFQAFRENSALRYLDISANLLYASGIRAAVIALANRTDGLELINFGQNSIGDDGVVFLTQSLRNNTAIRHLLLPYHNAITDAGASRIAKDLVSSSTTNLEFIDLSGNPVTVLGANAFISAMKLRSDRGLPGMRLQYDGWSVPPAVAKELKEAMSSVHSNSSASTVASNGSPVANSGSSIRKSFVSESEFRASASKVGDIADNLKSNEEL